MSARDEHRRDFNEWLEQILLDNQFDVSSCNKVLNHLSSCSSASALLGARDKLCNLLHEELSTSSLSTAIGRMSLLSTCEELSDEIVARYYLTDCNSEERASVDSGVDEDQAPQHPLMQQIPVTLTPLHNNDSGNISLDEGPDDLFHLGEHHVFSVPKFVTPRGHLPQPPLLKIGSVPTRIGPGYYPQLPGRNCVAAYRHKTPAQVESSPVNTNRARVLSATYDNNDIQQFYASPRSNSMSANSNHMPMGFVQPTVCDLNAVMNMGGKSRRSKHKSLSGTSPPEQRFFTPIRSDSMQWAYDEVVLSVSPQREIHRPTAAPPPVQSFLATLSQRRAPETPKIDDANAKLEDDELLSFVGGIAAHQPLCDADDE